MILLTDDEGRRRGERSAGAERRLVGRSEVFPRPLKAAVGGVAGAGTERRRPLLLLLSLQEAWGEGRGVEGEDGGDNEG